MPNKGSVRNTADRTNPPMSPEQAVNSRRTGYRSATTQSDRLGYRRSILMSPISPSGAPHASPQVGTMVAAQLRQPDS